MLLSDPEDQSERQKIFEGPISLNPILAPILACQGKDCQRRKPLRASKTPFLPDTEGLEDLTRWNPVIARVAKTINEGERLVYGRMKIAKVNPWYHRISR